MKLEYHILWFEDQPRNVQAARDNINNAISRLGFTPVIGMKEVTAGSTDPLAGLPGQVDVDLVLVDWKLGGAHDGANLARRIRRLFSNTDIIFYSAEPAKHLRQLIFEQGIDGVHCFNRTSLSDRTISLIRSQLKKILGLDHMRGVVMAVTSDLDHAMIRCMEAVQALIYPNNLEVLAAKIGRQVADTLRKKADEIEGIASKGKLGKLLRDPSFGASLRLAILKAELQGISDKITEAHLVENLDRYASEVISPRNDFAHRPAEFKDGKLYLEGRNVPFDEQSMTALRLKLLEHADSLNGLFSLLREMAVATGDTEASKAVATFTGTPVKVKLPKAVQNVVLDEELSEDQQ